MVVFLVGLYREKSLWVGYILGTNIVVSGKRFEDVFNKLRNILLGIENKIEDIEPPGDIDIITRIEV